MVLYKKSLNYYKENRRSSCIGSIDLSEIQTVRPLPEKGGTRFEISTRTRSFIFVADSSETCKMWVSQIQEAWAVESTPGDDSTISHNSSKETKHEDFSQIGSTAAKKKNWEKMSNTSDSPISQASLGSVDLVVQRRPSKKDKSDSQKLESDIQNGIENQHLSGPYDRPWTSILSVFKDEDPSSSSIEASADPESSGTQQRNDPNNETSCVRLGLSNDKVKDDLAHKIENDDGECSQMIISEPNVTNSCSDQIQKNVIPNEIKESPTKQEDLVKSEPGDDFVEMRRSRTFVKVHRDGSVTNVEDAYRYSQEPGMRSKSGDVSKLQRQEAFESHSGSQPEASEDGRETAESSKALTPQHTIVNCKPEAIAVEALDQRPSVDSQSDLVQKTSEAKTSASLKPITGKLKAFMGNAVPLTETKSFKPYALKELKIFLEHNCDLVNLNLNSERYSTAEFGMKALKEFLDGI